MTVETITPVKRKSGGQPGNRNAYRHGVYARQKTPAVLALDSVCAALPGMPSVDPRYFVRENLLLIEKIDSVLAVIAPKMLLAETHKDTLTWFRPVLKLVRAKQQVIRSILLLENPRRTLLALSRKLLYYSLWEFRERGLREYPITPPPDFDRFCVDPYSTSYSFQNNTIFPPSGAKGLVPRIFLKSPQFNVSHIPLMIPSPFLTDQQWHRLESSFLKYQERMDSSRKYLRRTKAFPFRLLLEAIFIKLAFKLPWEELPSYFRDIHPNIPSFPLRRCQSFYRQLYYSGFLQGVYRQLYLHLQDYGDYPLKQRIIENCFEIDKSAVFLASGQPLIWQNFTALLLLQRGYHNYRAVNHANKA